ncbi:MAG: DsrE family protein [Nitrospinae bacterium]|nr:DsrE family protein [Nitrospinota bacterium]
MNVAIMLTREPYGSINAAEAIRHALGAVANDLRVSLVLTDGGVLTAARGQNEADSGFTSLEGAIRDLLSLKAPVLVDRESLGKAGLAEGGLIEGVTMVDPAGVARAIAGADHLLFF